MSKITSEENKLTELVAEEATPIKSPIRRRLIKAAVTAGFLSLPTAGYAHYIEPSSIRVAELDIPLKGWPSSKDGFRIGHISDLHADNDRALARTREAVRILQAQKPDAVFITGDYITRRARPHMNDCAAALGLLAKAPHGAYSSGKSRLARRRGRYHCGSSKRCGDQGIDQRVGTAQGN